ncbi:MAG TPA: 3-(methylthio)propionyl-CoA ligase [Parvibaculum sp.]|uniref:3-(methylthio)propionyl-CoA ligase n=1 Tax=Parvibaculum sp. TaxID=2024848 RepID=UPI002B878833|nr:3-(methylthio)propionyl-CoA ligase [Parvibaculum sp.]HMM13151.1 3-(methylthio)propionyl-CoA ligase [Parvibaculum sp.]
MKGLMQDWPLRVSSILDHAARFHGEREIVSRSVEGPIVRTTYAEMNVRARKVAQALRRLGVKEGEVVATLAWNTGRHMEAWYGIMGLGAVCHTLNPRLFAEQLVYIINHAEDKYIFVDLTFVPIVEAIEAQCPNVKGYVIMTDAAHMPQTKLRNALCYETLLDAEDGDFQWVEVDENAACGLCYTSGTTGNPKGVLYSHRSNVLHAMIGATADAMGLKSVDSVLPVVPMFHANAWGIAFSAPMVGAKIVMPGQKMDGDSICELLTTEEVTFTAAVPTVWLMLLQYLEKTGKTLDHLKRVVIGGSAAPRSMIDIFESKYGVEVRHAWGMTEMSPLGTLGSFKAGMEELSHEEKLDIKVKQGRPPYGVEMKITDDDGAELPWDGKAFGHLLVRGPSIAKSYLKGEGGKILDDDGWFDTGDVATVDQRGFMQITDRAKDVIKSGGEWISSIELENLAVGHPKVAEAAVIGIAHPKWDERPLLIVVLKEGETATKEEILHYMDGKIAKWWMPDDVAFIDEIPHTATGKIQKLALRDKFKDYKLPTANAAE